MADLSEITKRGPFTDTQLQLSYRAIRIIYVFLMDSTALSLQSRILYRKPSRSSNSPGFFFTPFGIPLQDISADDCVKHFSRDEIILQSRCYTRCNTKHYCLLPCILTCTFAVPALQYRIRFSFFYIPIHFYPGKTFNIRT